MIREAGPGTLLRAIFPEKPSDAPILHYIMQGETRIPLKDVLNEALDTLPLTRGKNDSGPWPRWKTVLDQSYGLNRSKLTRGAIAQSCRIDPRYVSKIKREALIELRRDAEVMERLEAFFIPAGMGTTFDQIPVSYLNALPP